MKILIGRKTYNDGQQTLEGFLAKPKEINKTTTLPAVIIFHTIMGLSEFEMKRAKFMARQGLVGFAADIYGKHIKNGTIEEGKNCSKFYTDNRNTLLRSRLNAALNFVSSLSFVNKDKIAAIGFGFGGLCVLDSARNNLGIKCGVIFHGNLSPITDYANVDQIQAKLLVCYGDMNPNSDKEVDELLQELRERRADFQFVRYSDAEDDFAIPAATPEVNSNTMYNKKADKRSSLSMLTLFSETLGLPKFIKKPTIPH